MSAIGPKRTMPSCTAYVAFWHKAPSVEFISAFGGIAEIDRSLPPIASVANDAVDGASSAASKCYRLVASKPSDKEVRPGNDDGV